MTEPKHDNELTRRVYVPPGRRVDEVLYELRTWGRIQHGDPNGGTFETVVCHGGPQCICWDEPEIQVAPARGLLGWLRSRFGR